MDSRIIGGIRIRGMEEEEEVVVEVAEEAEEGGDAGSEDLLEILLASFADLRTQIGFASITTAALSGINWSERRS